MIFLWHRITAIFTFQFQSYMLVNVLYSNSKKRKTIILRSQSHPWYLKAKKGSILIYDISCLPSQHNIILLWGPERCEKKCLDLLRIWSHYFIYVCVTLSKSIPSYISAVTTTTWVFLREWRYNISYIAQCFAHIR